MSKCQLLLEYTQARNNNNKMFELFLYFFFQLFSIAVDSPVELKKEMSYHVEIMPGDRRMPEFAAQAFPLIFFFRNRLNQDIRSKIAVWDPDLLSEEVINTALVDGEVYIRDRHMLLYVSGRLPSRHDIVKRYLWVVLDFLACRLIVTIAGTVEE